MNRLAFPRWYWFVISLFLTCTVMAPVSFVVSVLAPDSFLSSFDFIAILTWAVTLVAPIAWTTRRHWTAERKRVQMLANAPHQNWVPVAETPGADMRAHLTDISTTAEELRTLRTHVFSLQSQIVRKIEGILVAEIPRAAAARATKESAVTIQLGDRVGELRSAVSAYAQASPALLREKLNEASLWRVRGVAQPEHGAGRLAGNYPHVGRALSEVMEGLRELMMREGYSYSSDSHHYESMWGTRISPSTAELLFTHSRAVAALDLTSRKLANLESELQELQARAIWDGGEARPSMQSPGAPAGWRARISWRAVITGGGVGTILLGLAVLFVLSHPEETLALPASDTVSYPAIAVILALMGLAALYTTRLGTQFGTLPLHSRTVAVLGTAPGGVAIGAGVLLIAVPLLFWALVAAAACLALIVIISIVEWFD